MKHVNKKYRCVFWGTYDTGKPRVRLLIQGAKYFFEEVVECHYHVWKNVEDKSRVIGLRELAEYIFRHLLYYPKLVAKYLRLKKHDVVIIPYMGTFDTLILFPFTRIRGAYLFWDAFIPLYDTFVNDRKILGKLNPVSWFIYALEWMASRAADKVFLDTESNSHFFERLYHLPYNSVGVVPVGAEEEYFNPTKRSKTAKSPERPFTVLFYGQYIPLHGLDIIVKAAKLVDMLGIKMRWVLVGKGQEKKRIELFEKLIEVKNIRHFDWVPYESLSYWIRWADVCLGIFGTSGKTMRVIPNKVYQILASGNYLITADTPAIRELVLNTKCVYFVPPGDPKSLARRIIQLKTERDLYEGEIIWDKRPLSYTIGYKEVGERLFSVIEDVCLLKQN